MIDQIADVWEISEEGPMDAFVNVRRRTYVISEIKTRVNASMPKLRQLRPSEIQLSLYYKLLSEMIDGIVDINRLFLDLELDPNVGFSDGFLAEVSSATDLLTS